jgi:very-short-patch-repair endonuclease
MSDKPSDVSHFISVGQAFDGLVHEIESAAKGIDPLPGHPGRGPATLDNGRSRLFVKGGEPGRRSDREEVVWQIAKEQYEKGEKLCESPIERTLLAALLTADWGYFGTENALVHNPNVFEEEFPDCNVVIVPQLRIAKYRLDFALVLRGGRHHQVIAFECDGKQFHDAAVDRERDFYLQAFGIITHRISGADLNKRPLAATDEIVLGIYHWWEAAFR